ncbi:uncharacterized protein MYCFIDRAFT_86240 [Pseudocercospora fijiensis CIRAD86]|uniref:HECT-type E3 ubiquitin transferase n=1 Tax=Pseudocercospora fijiensis (strain CIRAD86) TaxID=383855 RepID=N1QCN2_PSEFD|nr:uncharacterized protein MYCFIDRAFT_86240 [Pseudocercospora fijiensis CIRAD86]EME89163.1 hypothetical protein MYCFIDRAFT_86240 [Pseudocercospora fijiensis CIRAD86]
MGRIKKVATERHTATQSPYVKEFVVKATEVPLHRLPACLDTFPQHWPLPRGDLYHWIPLLDRFDHVLENFNKEYALNEGPQMQPFQRRLLEKGDAEEGMPYPAAKASSQELDAAGYSAEGDRELVEAVLHFTRILLENCGNRSLYASSTHINDLLHTTSLSLLRLCLKLALRLAQRYQVARFKNHHPSAQPLLLANHYNINLDNLHKIALPFPKPYSSGASLAQTPVKGREKSSQHSSFNPADLVAIAKDPIAASLRNELSGVFLTYYEPSVSAPRPTTATPATEASPTTPTPTRRTSNLGPSRDRPSVADRSFSADDLSTTPIKSRETDGSSDNAPKLFNIPARKVADTPAWSLVKDAASDLPSELRYELLNRVRIAKAFASVKEDAQLILEIRLLAVANMAFALSESKFQERLGTADGDEPRRYHLAQQLCDLLQPATNGQTGLTLQSETAVIMTLDALTKTRHKVNEVADALSIAVNHGMLYYELRKVIATLGENENTDKHSELRETEWRIATFELVNSLLQSNGQARYGEKMVNAGIIGILVECLKLRTLRAERFHERILQFFDSFIHGIPTAFQTLANVRGLDTIADLTAFEVKAALESARNGNGIPAEHKSKVIDYDIPYHQSSVLRQLFKNTVHMFEHNSGGQDRLLRNLIDTPQILGALKDVIENAPLFGSNVWSGAVNIVSSFIHNEPTSYQVIGEAGLSKSLLESITGEHIPADLPEIGEIIPPSETAKIEAGQDGEPLYPSVSGILPVGEVMSDVPTAFGAICLNESGMQLFQASGALVKYFDIFLSPAHVRAMEEESQTATTIGHAFDELSRHQPRLKKQIMAAVFNMLKRLRDLTHILAERKSAGAKLWELQDDKAVISGGSAALRGASPDAYAEALAGKSDFLPSKVTEVRIDDHLEDEHERAPAVPFLSACFKFLDGFFHNNGMCQLFCDDSGAELLLDLAMTPSNPYDLVAFPLFAKITHVLKTMCEARYALVLPNIVRRTQLAVLGLKDLVGNESRNSSFDKFSNLNEAGQSPFPDGRDGTTVVKSLLNTHLLTHILGRTLAPPPYTLRHGHQNNHLFTNMILTDVYIELVDELSKLHAACLWENLLLQRNMPEQQKIRTEPKAFVMRRIDANGVVEVANDRTESSRSQSSASNGLNDSTSNESRRSILALKNIRAIRYLLSQVPMGIESFFQSLGQAIVTKRSDSTLKQHAMVVAEHLAQTMIWGLDVRRNKPDEELLELRYVSQMLTMIGRLLLRNSYSMESLGTKEALTMVMMKFYVLGGFLKLNDYLSRFVKLLAKEQEQNKIEPPVKDAIQSILTFYGQVVRSKCINEAPQSSVINNRDHKLPDYFQPGQLLVEIRDAVLPAINDIWHSQDLEKFTDANMRSIVDILRMILKAEGEDRALRREANAYRRVPAHKLEFKLTNTTGLEELAAKFNKTLAKEALYRCNHIHNQAEQYCELRAKDPRVPRFPIPDGETPSNEVTTSESFGQARSRSQPRVSTTSADETASVEMGNAGDGESGGLHREVVNPDDNGQAQETRQLYVTVDDLDEKRQALRADLIDRCLDVLSSQRDIAFELADLIQAAVMKSSEEQSTRAEISTTLVSSLISLKAEEPSQESGSKIHAYAHLVALILQDRDFFEASLDELKDNFESLVEWVELGPDQKAADAPWIETVLLIVERVLAEDEQPPENPWEPPPADNPLKPLKELPEPQAIVSQDLRSQLFGSLVGLLPKVGKNASLALSVSRVLVILTRKRELAMRLADRLTLNRLFTMIRQLAGSVDEKLQASFMLILRHMIEDDDTLRQIMRAEIRVALAHHKSSRALDTTTYTRNLSHLAIRNPKIFVEITGEMVEITRFDGNPNRGQQIGLKRSTPPEPKPKAESSSAKPTIDGDASEQQKMPEPKGPVVETTDGVVQFLLRELSNYRVLEDNIPPASKEDEDKSTSGSASSDVEMSESTPTPTPPPANASTAAAVSTADQSKNSKPVFKPEEHTIYIYRCFILQCLAELLASYNKTKMEFINFSRKSEAQPATPSKPRAGTLNYLLNALMPVGTLEHRDDVSHRKKAATSNWATQVLVALCTKTPERQSELQAAAPSFADFSEQEPELTFVRKFVLEHALRTFKEAVTSAEPLDLRYSRLLSLGELFNRMLNSKVDQQRANVVSAGAFSAHQQIGRLMYEKNFIGTLTSAIAELDLNFPNAKRAVKYILGPLKQLTDLGVTLSQSAELSSSTEPGTSTEEDEISSATSISGDEEDDDREHTPDLLRDTSLADQLADDDEDDDEDDDDDEMGYDEYDDGMDYEEEQVADHGEVVSDEDEDELDDMGDIEGVPGDVEMEIDVMMDDEDDEDDEDDDDDDSDEDDEDDVDDDDDEHGHDFLDHMDEITGDDENASLGEHEGDWEEEDEQDYGFEPEIEEDDDDDQDGGWTWDVQPPQAILRGGHHHHHHHHRGLGEIMGMIGGDPLRPMGAFSRSHRATPNPRDEDGVNPLLQRGTRFAGARRAFVPRQGDHVLQDLVAAVGPNGHTGPIDVVVHTGAMPGLGALPPMFVQSRLGGQAMIDIDPTRGWRENAGLGRWADPLTGRVHERGSGHHVEAQAVEFRTSQTSARWQEEARMLFPGRFQEKALQILNMIFRTLVPAAMQAKKIREEQEAERQAAAEKEAEEKRKQMEAEKAEREAQEKKEREEREAKEREEAEARAREQAEQAPEGDTQAEADNDMQGIEQDAPEGTADEEQPEAEPEQPPAERITMTIRGRELDITSLGIDREYIEALPEELREEVIMAQYAEQRSQQAESQEAPSEIDRSFLEALPRELQQELLRTEQHDRRRREQAEERRRRQQEGNAAPAQAEDMNNADFMAMLDPALRQAVLLDADDTVLAALPEDLQAEARALFGDRRPRADGGRAARHLEVAGARAIFGQDAGREEEATREVRQRRPVAQMLDKAGIATLLRLMFVSLNHKAKANLHGILSDICKNTQNRAEVISILLSILQDGTADVNAVERSFAQLSLRAKQPSAPKTPQPLKRSFTDQQNVLPTTELSPLNIVQQCLGTLNALANDNPRIPSFFLSEHETAASQKAKTVKKGKGKESKAAKFPLNALLTLLDRKLITENAAVMETLASLLKDVTGPLSILARRQKEAQEAANKASENQEQQESASTDVAMAESSGTSGAAETPAATSASTEAPKEATEAQPEVPATKKKHQDLTPPEVPDENIGLVVNILAARECPSKTFTDTLDIIKNLSAIPGAKEVFGKELTRQAQELGQTLLSDLEELATQIQAAQTGTDLQGMALASFSAAGSKQRKLLRVLVALDHLFDPKRIPQSTNVTGTVVEQKLKEDILATLYESPTFEKLWHSLSACLTAIRQRGNMVNVATILLPLIESLMVVCRNSALKEAPAVITSPAETKVSTPPPVVRMDTLFFNFTEEHRKVLNELIRNNPKLMNGNLSVLAKNSKVLEFDNKRNYFSRKLHDRRAEVRVAHPSLQLNIRRDQVFLDSFKSLYYKSPSEIKYGKLNIRFHGEEGIDAGGVSREWFAAMARQMFNPDYALFNPVAADRTTFHPNSLSEINPEHLMFFKFIGRVIGKALYENRVLDCHFSRAVYRKILGKSVSLKDMESLDLDYYKSLVWILENDITDVTFETFSVDVDKFGVTETIDLIPNGRNIAVTEENKQEYVRLVVDYRLIKSVQGQLDNFLEGFHDIIPAELVSIFNEQELELLISGLPDIDVDDWKNNTEYHNYQQTSPQVQWFWRAVRSFDKEEKAKLLQFVTGTSKVPLNGFKELEGMNGFSKFNIHRDFSSKEKLPSSHTCFNQLDLPEYESYEHLRHQLYTAITAGSEYFGFA